MANSADRVKLERLFIVLQVFNKFFDGWYKLVTLPSFFAGGFAVVVALYATIRHTDLPLLLYLLFPYMTVVFTVIMFDVCRDGFVAVRVSEDVLSRLRSTEMEHLSRLPMLDKMASLRRAKALRRIDGNVGIFGEYSIDIPVGVWNEILNEIFFLLTLL